MVRIHIIFSFCAKSYNHQLRFKYSINFLPSVRLRDLLRARPNNKAFIIHYWGKLQFSSPMTFSILYKI